jgi:hypothetical protein
VAESKPPDKRTTAGASFDLARMVNKSIDIKIYN